MTNQLASTIFQRSAHAVLLASAALALTVLPGCATNIKAGTTQNPPPAAAFSSYGRIVLKAAVFKPGYDGDAAGLASINANLKVNMAGALGDWNRRPDNGRTLTISPVVEEMSFKHGAKRVMLGPLAGSSAVLMRLNIKDDQGAVVATPEFYRRADAMAAGFTMGVHDNLMLTRVAELASNYLIANYKRAEGGPSGADEQAVGAKP